MADSFSLLSLVLFLSVFCGTVFGSLRIPISEDLLPLAASLDAVLSCNIRLVHFLRILSLMTLQFKQLIKPTDKAIPDMGNSLIVSTEK